MMSGYKNATVEMQKMRSPNPLAIAVGLIINDLSLIPLLVVLLTTSVILEFVGASFANSYKYAAMVLDVFGQIAAVSIIVLRWRTRLQSAQGPRVRALPVIARIAGVSLMTCFILTTPVTGAAMSHDPSIAVAFLVLLILGCIWALRVYFFFAIAGLLGLPFRAAFVKSVEMARGNAGLIIKSLIAPCALTLLASALFLMPYPDGRSLPWIAASAASECIFWILSTYIALGFALTMFSDYDWRAAGLSHYRTDRLNTLQAQGGKTLPKYLSPRTGLLMLAVALCFLAGNLVRLGQLPPAAKVDIARADVKDYTIQVELKVEDHVYHFRGFQPQAFFVASKTGTPLSNGLISASRSADSKEVIAFVDTNQGEATPLYLTFSSTKTGEVLKSLDNMWLWYRAQPLLPITSDLLRRSEQ